MRIVGVGTVGNAAMTQAFVTVHKLTKQSMDTIATSSTDAAMKPVMMDIFVTVELENADATFPITEKIVRVSFVVLRRMADARTEGTATWSLEPASAQTDLLALPVRIQRNRGRIPRLLVHEGNAKNNCVVF